MVDMYHIIIGILPCIDLILDDKSKRSKIYLNRLLTFEKNILLDSGYEAAYDYGILVLKTYSCAIN